LDIEESAHTTVVGTIADRELVRRSMEDIDAVIHTATLHKPHIGSHTRSDFVNTNISGTLNLLEEAAASGVRAFVFTSTTSAFGRALIPADDAPAPWITEDVAAVPRNIYGVTKTAAEDLCELAWRDHRLPCMILRTSRFFPEADDNEEARATFDDLNLKVNELLYRRVDLEDVVAAHRLALGRAPAVGFGRYIITATTPFARGDVVDLRADTASVVRRLYPHYEEIYAQRGWTMLDSIDRVYVNTRARKELDWNPRFDFAHALDRLRAGEDPRSLSALSVGKKGYHAEPTGVYTTGGAPDRR
jgi:nucleoside-diphosphate-sugar epimerase